MQTNYAKVIAALREAYDLAVEEREKKEITPWKAEERQRFLELLQREGKTTLLEIGAGTGRDSLFFQQQDLTVTRSNHSNDPVVWGGQSLPPWDTSRQSCAQRRRPKNRTRGAEDRLSAFSPSCW